MMIVRALTHIRGSMLDRGTTHLYAGEPHHRIRFASRPTEHCVEVGNFDQGLGDRVSVPVFHLFCACWKNPLPDSSPDDRGAAVVTFGRDDEVQPIAFG